MTIVKRTRDSNIWVVRLLPVIDCPADGGDGPERVRGFTLTWAKASQAPLEVPRYQLDISLPFET